LQGQESLQRLGAVSAFFWPEGVNKWSNLSAFAKRLDQLYFSLDYIGIVVL